MDITEMNRRAAQLLEEWDPFNLGEGQYDTEIGEVLANFQSIDHPTDLAKSIQMTYESSFARWIPIEKCMDLSYKLFAVKYEAKCTL